MRARLVYEDQRKVSLIDPAQSQSLLKAKSRLSIGRVLVYQWNQMRCILKVDVVPDLLLR